MIRTYSTLVGFTVGFMASSISLMTQNNLIAATIIGTAFTVIGYFAPYEWIKVKSKKNNKKLAQKLMKEMEEITQEMEKTNIEELTLKELMKNNKKEQTLTKYIKEEKIQTLEELKEKIEKLG